MARRPIAKPGPLPMEQYLDELNRKLKEQTGKPIEVPVRSEDIGGELLAILSKGLYPDPLDCIREYAQNSVDADAKRVTVKITGNSVLIHDDGNGMDIQNLLEARQFGISTKSIHEHVGFRGIGIYSGFDMCNRLIITTKKAGESYQYILDFDFGAMKTRLDTERQGAKSHRTPLIQLLTEYSHFTSEPISDPESHYTTVQLEEIDKSHIERLSDHEKLRKYMLVHLPIDFADDFPYREKIVAALYSNVPGYKAITIALETDFAAPEIINRPAIPDLGEPIMNYIYNKQNERIAYYWACLHKSKPRGRIPDTYKDYRGFVYKVKGFTIGDTGLLEVHFKRGNGALYKWYTGEVFVLDSNVVPNAARDNFESSTAKTHLEIALQNEMAKLDKDAEDYREQGRADEQVEQASKQLIEVEKEVTSSMTYDRFHAYNILGGIVTQLETQLKKTSNKANANDLLQKARRLQRTVSNTPDIPLDHPKPRSTKKKPVPDQQITLPISLPDDSRLPLISDVQSPSTKQIRTLIEVLDRAEWDLTKDCTNLIKIIDAAMIEVLESGSPTYTKLIDEIEAKLMNGTLE